MERLKFEVFVDRRSVEPFTSTAVEEADKDKEALGFLSSKVFYEFAAKEQLFIAVDAGASPPVYVGHILFDCKYPRCSVLQINVVESCRGLGVAKSLLRSLREHLIPVGFTSIAARVAEDLENANRFYQSQDFYIQNVMRGGASRKRTILRRVLELPTPQLFSASGLSEADPLGLCRALPVEQPVYLLDLNVVRDIGPRRPRNGTVVSLFKAARMGIYLLGVSSEAKAELRRTATRKTDPLADFLKVFPEFRLPATKQIDGICDAVLRLVFPLAPGMASATPQQASDVRHIATVIHFKLAGIVTSDGAILEASSALEKNFRIKAISPEALTVALPESTDAGDSVSTQLEPVDVRPISGTDLLELRGFFGRWFSRESAQLEAWVKWDIDDSGHHYLATAGTEIVGYAGLRVAPGRNTFSARLAIDEIKNDAEVICSALIRRLEDHLTDGTVRTVHMELPSHQAATRETALTWGYRGPTDGRDLVKTYGAQVVTPKTWTKYRDELLASSGIRLPPTAPIYAHADLQISIVTPKGERTFQTCEQLESLLRPVLFALDGRPAVITPIRREYSAGLLEHLPQWSLLGHERPSIFPTKHYVAGAQVMNRVERGSLMLFYESTRNGGSGSIVAIARIRQAYVKAAELMDKSDLDPSILDGEALIRIGTSTQKTILTFDNIMRFRRPVGLATLRDLGCGDSHKLLSTSAITPTQLQSILDHAFPPT
jgi:GNAT superfamily N-acetyltransferase